MQAWILREVAAITSGTIAFGLLDQAWRTQYVFHIVAQILPRENSRDINCVKPSIQYIPVTFWTVQNGAKWRFCANVARKIPPSLQREANLLALALLHPLRWWPSTTKSAFVVKQMKQHVGWSKLQKTWESGETDYITMIGDQTWSNPACKTRLTICCKLASNSFKHLQARCRRTTITRNHMMPNSAKYAWQALWSMAQTLPNMYESVRQYQLFQWKSHCQHVARQVRNLVPRLNDVWNNSTDRAPNLDRLWARILKQREFYEVLCLQEERQQQEHVCAKINSAISDSAKSPLHSG